jgi:hypothetical protein
MFGAVKDEVTRDWRKFHNEERRSFYLSNDQTRGVRWARRVVLKKETRNACRVLIWKREGKRPLGKYRGRWAYYIKMELKEMWQAVSWTNGGTLSCDHEPKDSQIAGNVVTSWGFGSFWPTAALHRVTARLLPHWTRLFKLQCAVLSEARGLASCADFWRSLLWQLACCVPKCTHVAKTWWNLVFWDVTLCSG